MSELFKHKYLFLVRQRFGSKPTIDSFYETQAPNDVSTKDVEIMNKLKGDYYTKELRQDASTLKGMRLRLRYNTDMYPHVLLVKSDTDITIYELSMHIEALFDNGKLEDFLRDAAI